MFSDIETEYLTAQPIARLATVQPDGTVQVNPVGFRVNQVLGTIDIEGYNMARSRKFRNVADNGRAALVVDDIVSTDPWRVRFLEVRGHGETVAEPGKDLGDAIIRLYPQRIIAMGLNPGDQNIEPHKLTIDSREAKPRR